MEPELVTIPEAAACLGLSTRTIQRLIAAGALDAIHIGRAHRIRVESLRRLIHVQPDASPERPQP